MVPTPGAATLLGLAVGAALQSDIQLLQGATLYFTLLTIAINLVVDLLYFVVDPRLRVERSGGGH